MRNIAVNRERFSLSKKLIHVVAAVIQNNNKQLLIAKRPKNTHQGGLWEFSGGKVETNEVAIEALKRELKEELNITLDNNLHRIKPYIKIQHHYSDKSILLDIYHVNYSDDTHNGWLAKGNEGQEIRWVDLSNINDFAFPVANQKILKCLKAPQNIAILAPDFNAPVLSENTLNKFKQQGTDALLLRTPLYQDADYIKLYKQCKSQLSAFREGNNDDKVRVFINRPSLAHILENGDGLHLTAENMMRLSKRSTCVDELLGLGEKCLLSASCHNEQELRKAESLSCDFALLSPVAETNSHSNAQPLGWQKFSEYTQSSHIPIFALGGMTPSDLSKAKEWGGFGIAGISHFS